MQAAYYQFLCPARTVRLVMLATLPMWVTVAALAGGKAETGKAAASSELLARYQQERALCNSGQSNQDRATCLREAGAAYAEAKRAGLGVAGASPSDNQRKRCDPLTGDERSACLARMQGQGSVSGSVQSGGILRELVTREPPAPKARMPAPRASDPTAP